MTVFENHDFVTMTVFNAATDRDSDSSTMKQYNDVQHQIHTYSTSTSAVTVTNNMRTS